MNGYQNTTPISPLIAGQATRAERAEFDAMKNPSEPRLTSVMPLFTHAEKLLEELHGEISRTEAVLTPILVPEPKTGICGSGPAELSPEDSMIAHRLVQLIGAVHLASARVRNITGRIQLEQ